MKTFKEAFAQGDIYVRRIVAIPPAAKAEPTKIVAHSETGHHHSFDDNAAVFVYSTPDELVSYLKVTKPAVLRHRRDFDTHEEVLFDAGTYEIRRQREHAPEGWRKVVD